MGIYETFSKRQKKRERKAQLDVYQYETLPEAFRIQVAHIWKTALGPYVEPDPYGFRSPGPTSNIYWRQIHSTLAREKGVFNLAAGKDAFVQCEHYLLSADTDGALDIIELSFRVIDYTIRELGDYDRSERRITQLPDDAIQELNHRFQEHGIGYQYLHGEVVRVDSQYIHAEVVKPAISLLQEAGFRGPSDEFLDAHDHYRKGNYKEAIAGALKAFESTMKAICDARKWPYSASATAKPLIDVLLKNGLIPTYLESHFAGLRAAMESGLPTVRDKTSSAHGQGAEPVTIPGHMAGYALHLAAADIVFLVEAHKPVK
jgi:hypothetical protein